MAILSVLVSAVYTVTLSLQKGYDDQVTIAEMQQQARVAFSLFSNEVQNAGLDPTGNAFTTGTTTKPRRAPLFRAPLFKKKKDCREDVVRDARPIMEASPTVFHFMGDLDKSSSFNRDCKDCDENEDIRYEWVGESGKTICGQKKDPYTLNRDTGGGLQEVASGIREFRLAYRDENGNELIPGPFGLNAENRGKIRKILLTIRAATSTESNAYKQEWTSEIILKNRG